MPALVLLATFLSGAAALAAEIAWFRGLGRGVGTSAEALAVVSAAFLGGLGIGAGIASRFAPRSAAPFRAAAICEAAAAVLVFSSPWAVKVVPALHLAVLDALGLDPGPSAWPAALVAVPVLVLPCAFLGATLPFLVRGLVASLGRAGGLTGALYGVNTLGAAAGVVAVVFVLLPLLGETASLRAAAAGNALAALLILLAERPTPEAASEERTTDPSAPALARGAASRADLALFATGALALGSEVAWFRLLEPLIDISAIGLAFLLAPILVGTALGAFAGGRLADRVRRPDLALAATTGLAGLLTVLSLPGSGLVPLVSAALADGEDALTAWKVAASAACVLLPLVAFAAAYPLAVRARAASTPGAVRASGAVYAWNTAGNVVGSLAAGFVLLPMVGAPRTLVLFGATGLGFAAALWLASTGGRRQAWALAFLAPVALLAWPGAVARLERSGPSLPEVVALGRWHPSHGRVRNAADLRAYAELVGGVYPSPAHDPDAPPIQPREGRVGSVGLLREAGVVRVRQGGLSESMFRDDDPDAGSETEVALALAPWLLHPHPRTALVIGHGAGWTVETLLATGMPEVDVAELEPAVLDVVEQYRGRLPIRDAGNARLHVADGRLLLRRAAARGGGYDLVVSQPSHPWVPGAGHLFTAEAYRLARSALRPGGVFAQWLNLFHMDRELFHTAIASWLETFADGWLLLFEDEVVLVGFTAPTRILPERWEAAFRPDSAVGRKAVAAGIDRPQSLFRRLAADGAGMARMVGPGAPPATDDDPRLELGLARARMSGGGEVPRVVEEIRSIFPPDFAAALPDAAVRGRWVTAVIREALDEHRLQEARRWAEQVPVPLDLAGRRERARLAREAGDWERAEQLLRGAVAEAKDDGGPRADLLDVLIDAGKAEDAVEAGRPFADEHPDHGPVHESLARALLAAGRTDDAEAAFRRALAARTPLPPKDTAHELARLLLTADPPKKWEAREALLSDPRALASRDALEQLIGLEIEFVEDGRVPAETLAEHEEALEVAKAAHGERQLRLARRDLRSDPKRALRAAVASTEAAPRSVEAWRLRGWLELRTEHEDRAVSSFRSAIESAPDDERDAERARAVAFLRMADVDPARLAEQEPLP